MSRDGAERQPLVFATVGTDHHPFDRLISWIDEWYTGHTRDRARCFVQFGTSKPPLGAEGAAYVGYEELQRFLDEAAVVVSHGGPNTIMEVRRRGLRPLVVPRRQSLGEHVDDHQVAFVRRLAAIGDVLGCETAEELGRMLDEAMAAPGQARSAAGGDVVAETVATFAQLVDHLVDRSRTGSDLR